MLNSMKLVPALQKYGACLLEGSYLTPQKPERFIIKGPCENLDIWQPHLQPVKDKRTAPKTPTKFEETNKEQI